MRCTWPGRCTSTSSYSSSTSPPPRARALSLLFLLHRHFHLLLDGLLQKDGEGKRLRIALDQPLQCISLGKLLGGILEVERDLRLAAQGVPARALDDGEDAVGRRLSHVLLRPILPGGHPDLVRDQVIRVETYIELSDEGEVLALSQGVDRVGRARLRDNAQVVHLVVSIHAHNRVADHQDFLVLVRLNVHLQVGLDIEGGSVTDGHEADFVRGVQGVENDFTEKDFLRLVEGVDDNVHKSGNFDLELCVQRSEDMGGKEKE